MFNYSKQSEEIAQSYVNGNILWVKEKLYGKKQLRLEVRQVLKDCYSLQEFKAFCKLFNMPD